MTLTTLEAFNPLQLRDERDSVDGVYVPELRAVQWHRGAGPRSKRLYAGPVASVTLATLIAVVGVASPVTGSPGDLDPTFGTGGIVTTPFQGASGGVRALAVDADGNVTAVGTLSTSFFALTRYVPSGALDVTFGNGGIAQRRFFNFVSTANALVLQPDGKLLVAGSAFTPITFPGPFTTNSVIARYNADGSPDSTFVMGSTNFGGCDAYKGIVVEPDGKVVVAGERRSDENCSILPESRFTLARYLASGALDGTFGTGGIVTTSFPSPALANAIVRQADGKLVVAGVMFPSTNGVFALARYNTDGSLDAGFGSGGTLTTPFAGQGAAATDLLMQDDGRVVSAGIGAGRVLLARYNGDGTLDHTFGTLGVVETTFAGHSATGTVAVVRSAGRLVAVGSGTNSTGFLLAGYEGDGSLDQTFGHGGLVTTSLGASSAFASDLVVSSDGKLVGGGIANGSFVLARYLVDGDPTPTATLGPSATATPPPTTTSSATATATATRTPTQASSPTPTFTPTARPTDTLTPLPTATATPLRTATQTATASDTPTATVTHSATALTATPTPTPTAPPPPVLGDANCDGRVTAADLPELAQLMAGSSGVFCGADVNGDGAVTGDDLREMFGILFRQSDGNVDPADIRHRSVERLAVDPVAPSILRAGLTAIEAGSGASSRTLDKRIPR